MAQALTDSLLAGWLGGAVAPVRELPPPPPTPLPLTGPPLPPLPPLGAGPLVPTGDGEPLVRLPLIEAAARDLAERQVMTRADFDALAEGARRSAFTVARVSSLDALAKIQSALAASVAQGGTLADFRTAVDAALDESALSAHHVETVYRTNVMAAYTRGLAEVLREPLVSDEFPYLAYHAVHDGRVREEHLALEGLGLNGTNVYRRDDPVWQKFLPPWDYNCRCHVVPLTVEDAAALGVHEAQEWMRTGVPPARGAWVAPPPFAPPPGWESVGMPAII